MVDRVLMKRLPKFEGRRWRSCRVMATEVGGDLLVDAGGERGAEIKLRAKFWREEFGKGSIRTFEHLLGTHRIDCLQGIRSCFRAVPKF
jgi:hypothetical protein